MKRLTSHRAERSIVSLVATVFVFGPVLAWSLGAAPEAIENRNLAPAPAAAQGWEAFDALSPWATDHLPGRAKAVHLNAWLEYNMLRQVPASQRSGPGGAASTPAVVRGRDGYLFIGGEFTNACSQAARYEQSLKSLSRLAEIIEASGRRVVFTVAPNKSSVTTDDLPRAVPRGDCALRAIEQQNQLIDGIRHPLYLGIRKPLADAHAAGRQVYFRTDTHWTMLGGALYAQALATRLDPGLAPRLRLEPIRHTRIGDLTKLIGLTSPESLTSSTLSSGATVFPAPKKAARDGHPVYQPESWITRPGKDLVQGNTLLLGDSFTGAALSSLRPIFAQGRFVVFRLVPQKQLISEIRSADTVVIEVIGRDIGMQVPTEKKFQNRVAAALGVPAG